MLDFDDWAREGAELDRTEPGPALEVGAALIARDAYPDLSVERVIATFDELARPLADLRLHEAPVEGAVRVLSEHLYGSERFRGNEESYGDPRNSYLNEVLSRRTGIPITLAVVLMGVARRVGVRASGVSFPGHFLVRFERLLGSALMVDPFHGGRVLGTEDLKALLRRSAGQHTTLEARHLEPATTRTIVVRMLQNLKAAHAARGDYARALVACTRILSLVPDDPGVLRDRGMLQAQLGAPDGARADLQRYLELVPNESDAANVRKVLDTLAAKVARSSN